MQFIRYSIPEFPGSVCVWERRWSLTVLWEMVRQPYLTPHFLFCHTFLILGQKNTNTLWKRDLGDLLPRSAFYHQTWNLPAQISGQKTSTSYNLMTAVLNHQKQEFKKEVVTMFWKKPSCLDESLFILSQHLDWILDFGRKSKEAFIQPTFPTFQPLNTNKTLFLKGAALNVEHHTETDLKTHLTFVHHQSY